ncbi:hypothetical protein AK812_SmicGene31180 [Symbiodinium microadriaticum]|uniref:Uncharacterized protein n=1 Tax=Symbiodinium microadriaticum TaxID=2951 RepID=A0A1Q9CXG6_SYMMI|nr:hypothetical protein AK812_SmicGene31180 [Symbiodinium microadriaticum]
MTASPYSIVLCPAVKAARVLRPPPRGPWAKLPLGGLGVDETVGDYGASFAGSFGGTVPDHVDEPPALEHEECEHCAKVLQAATTQRPGAHHTPDPVVRKLKSGEKADWSCRLCKVGIPSGATAPVSHRRFYVAREGHRKQAHPKLSAKKFKKLETLRMTRDPKIVMKHRARMLNKSRAKHLSGDALPGVLAFSWPHPRKRKASDGLDTKLVLKSAWRCSKCVYRTRSPTEAKRHTCGGLLLPKFIKARVAQLKKMRKQVAKLQHGIAADLLEGVFTKALDMVGGDSVDP